MPQRRIKMEKNDVMVLNEIIYRLYDRSSAVQDRERRLLADLRTFLHCPFASILHAAPSEDAPAFRDPICDPASFLPAEEAYIRLSGEDHMLWSSIAGRPAVVRESSMLSESARQETAIYLACYQKFGIYDTLQTNLFSAGRLLGVLTLYRTKKEGVFSDDDVFVMQCLSCHLSRLLEVEKQKENRAAGPSALRGERVRKLSASHGLTDRESEILSLLLKGSADRDIAESLSISEGTLKKHIQHIYRKLGISARWELIVFLSEDLY